jgi:hypothetical protein
MINVFAHQATMIMTYLSGYVTPPAKRRCRTRSSGTAPGHLGNAALPKWPEPPAHVRIAALHEWRMLRA